MGASCYLTLNHPNLKIVRNCVPALLCSLSGISNEAYGLGWTATRWIPAGVSIQGPVCVCVRF
jgi:hypothetical protein